MGVPASLLIIALISQLVQGLEHTTPSYDYPCGKKPRNGFTHGVHEQHQAKLVMTDVEEAANRAKNLWTGTTEGKPSPLTASERLSALCDEIDKKSPKSTPNRRYGCFGAEVAKNGKQVLRVRCVYT